MHRVRTTALVASLWLMPSFGPAIAADPGEPPAIVEARQRLARQDAAGAVTLLESALPNATASERRDLVGLLRQAYDAAARQAEGTGRAAEAEAYRDNLAILDRKPKPAVAAAATSNQARPVPLERVPTPLPLAEVPERPELERPRTDAAVVRAQEVASEPPAQNFVAPLPEPREPSGALDPAAPSAPAAISKPGAIQLPTRPEREEAIVSPFESAEAPSPAPAARPIDEPSPRPAPPAQPEVSVGAADAAFVAQRYSQAGAIYAALDRSKKLPPGRRDHWAYCRAVDVARRINARPTSPREWAAIDAEIAQIRALSPSNWFGEYLRNRAAERNAAARGTRSQRSNKVVVRGSSPEEEAFPPAAEASAGPVAWAKQPVQSENFQVVYPEGQRALAEQVARGAEAARAAGMKRWGDPAPGRPWSPKCEIRLFPTAAAFSRETGQPADSPGFSTMGLNAGAIVFRRVNLRLDHPNVVRAILPHEVTHVVLADLFPHKQVPRWADEGMAVLSEPTAEQGLRASDLDAPLSSGQLFKLSDLMLMDYPDARYWGLYYAQSVSLTRFLVERGTPEQFVRFVREAQTAGFEPALRQVYQVQDFNELQDRWLAFARSRATAELTASRSASDSDPASAPGSATERR